MSIKVLIISRNYPNNAMNTSGLWVEGLVHHVSIQCETRVIAPVPYCPPLPGFASYFALRRIQPQVNGVEVWRPRFLVGPGYWLYSFEASMLLPGCPSPRGAAPSSLPCDLIHAHFSYPGGVVATRLGQDYRIPVVITEHAPWQSWMDTSLTPMKRLVYLAAAPLIPLVLLQRTARLVFGKGRHVGKLLATLPMLAAFFGAWACGEALGYVRGPSR